MRCKLDRKLFIKNLVSTALISLVVGLSFISSSAAAKVDTNLTKITIALSPFQDTLLPVIGKEKGWFKSAGLDVQFRRLAWNSIVRAVASGSADVAVYNTTGIVSAHKTAPNLIYWYPWNAFKEGAALMARPDSSLHDISYYRRHGLNAKEASNKVAEQLLGEKIVTTKSTDMGKAVRFFARNHGIDPKKLDIVNMGPDQGLAVFLSGTGDLYLGGIPQRTRLANAGYRALVSGPNLAPVPLNGWITTKDFALAHEDSMLKLQHVMFKIIQYTDSHTQQVGKVITKKINKSTGAGMSVDDFEKYWNDWEEFFANPSEVEDSVLSPNGYAYWKETWDSDNQYFKEVSHDISKNVPYSLFWGRKIQKEYQKRYGKG